MAFDIMSALTGGGIALLLIILGAIVLISLLFGRVREQLKYVLGKLYSRTSLMLIAIFDVVAAFADPTQTILGLAIAPICGIVVFLSEWGLHDKFDKKRLGGSFIEGIIAAIIIAIPLPIAGLFVAWFGLYGPKTGNK